MTSPIGDRQPRYQRAAAPWCACLHPRAPPHRQHGSEPSGDRASARYHAAARRCGAAALLTPWCPLRGGSRSRCCLAPWCARPMRVWAASAHRRDTQNVEGAVLERRHEAESYNWLLLVAFIAPSRRRLSPPPSALSPPMRSTTRAVQRVQVDLCILSQSYIQLALLCARQTDELDNPTGEIEEP